MDRACKLEAVLHSIALRHDKMHKEQAEAQRYSIELKKDLESAINENDFASDMSVSELNSVSIKGFETAERDHEPLGCDSKKSNDDFKSTTTAADNTQSFLLSLS